MGSRASSVGNTRTAARSTPKSCSAFIRRATAAASGRARSFSLTSEVTATASRPHRRDAPALQEGDEEDADRGEVEDVLRAGVHRAPHLHDLEGPEQVPAALEVPRDDDAVRDRLLHAIVGVPLLRGADLGDEEGRAPAGTEHRAELQDEVPDVLLGLQAIADGRDRVDHEPLDLQLVDDVPDRRDQDVHLLELELELLESELVVDHGEVDEHEAAVLDQLPVEEVVRDDVREELVGGLRDADVQGVLPCDRAVDEELQAEGRLPGADAARDQDRVPPRDPAAQDVVEAVDAGDAPLALLRDFPLPGGHRAVGRGPLPLGFSGSSSMTVITARGPLRDAAVSAW